MEWILLQAHRGVSDCEIGQMEPPTGISEGQRPGQATYRLLQFLRRS
jgi:hypothetical protein